MKTCSCCGETTEQDELTGAGLCLRCDAEFYDAMTEQFYEGHPEITSHREEELWEQ